MINFEIIKSFYFAKWKGPFEYPMKSFIVRPREISKSRDLVLEVIDRNLTVISAGSTTADVPVKFQSDAII